MSFNTVICNRCGQSLTVSPNAPLWLICPKCLGRVQNPAGRPPGQGPLPIVPLDRQAQSDFRVARPLELLLAPLIVLGLVLMVAALGPRAAVGPLLLAGVAAAVATGFYFAQESSHSCTTGCLVAAAPIAVLVLGIIALLFGLCAAAAVSIH
jgi:uncharacterized membrane protein